MGKEKKLIQFTKNYSSFYPKYVTELSKIWVWDPDSSSKIWDPGYKIRDPEKTCSGSRIKGSKRHLIPDPESGSAKLSQ